MTLRPMLAVALMAGAVCVGSAFGIDPRTPSNNTFRPQPHNQALPYDLPTEGFNQINPFSPTPGAFPGSRQRLDLVSFPGQDTTPGQRVPATLGPNSQVQPRIAPGQIGPAPIPSKKHRWRMGVYTQNTDTGVRVMRIQPGSPAAQARLEPNDLIVSVGGYQVGNVHGVLHDLGSEFDLRCDDNGVTDLLVQDSRSGQLVNIPVQLEPRFSNVTGEVVWKATYPLPRESFAHVELREYIRPGVPMITIAETAVYQLRDAQKSQTARVPFELEYNPTDIDPTRQYFVVATITDGFHTLYQTTQQHAVITQRNPRRVDVAMSQMYDWVNHVDVADTSHESEFDQFVAMFEKYMGRKLRPSELYQYRNDFDHGRTIDDALVNVIGSPEFNTRARSDRDFIIRAFQMRTGDTPSERDIQYWVSQLQRYDGIKRNFARDFIDNLN